MLNNGKVLNDLFCLLGCRRPDERVSNESCRLWSHPLRGDASQTSLKNCLLNQRGSLGFRLLLRLSWGRLFRFFLNGLHDLMLGRSLLLHQLRPLTGGECVRPTPQPLATGGRCVLVSQGRRCGLCLLRIFGYQFVRPLFIVVLVECLN